MINKNKARLRRATKLRKNTKFPCMSVHRSNQHIYVQVFDENWQVLCAASTQDKSLQSDSFYGGNCESAKKVGVMIAQRCLDKGIKSVAFDRSGFKYHGRIKALADAAREGGIEF